MLVKDWMTKEPLVVSPKTSIEEAIRTMRQNRVRHLPVVKNEETLVGIVTQTDLLQASPSPATSLSVWEVNFLLSRMQVRDAMNTPVVVVDEECPLEEAALVMGEHKYVLEYTTDKIARALGNTLVSPIITYVPEGEWGDEPTGHFPIYRQVRVRLSHHV